MAMAMGRILSQGLVARHQPISISISPLILTQRHRSGKPHRSQLIELDLESSSTSSDGAGGIHKLQDVIRNIIARRAAPDWLPFLPGYSYWVPPTITDPSLPGNFIEVFGKLSATAASLPNTMTQDETMSFRSSCGWPSSSYFIQGSAPSHPVPVGVEVEVKVSSGPTNESSNADEESG